MTKKSKDVRLKQLMRLGICVALIALIAMIGAVMALVMASKMETTAQIATRTNTFFMDFFMLFDLRILYVQSKSRYKE